MEQGLKYFSVCTGISCESVAWGQSMGWHAAAYAEIEKFPSAVLQHHYPDVPNLGDITKVTDEQIRSIGPVDVAFAGTPCQSFSVAGKRAGLDDPRGQLAFEYLRLCAAAHPRWIIWENVPGVLSSEDGRDFGSFIGALGDIGYQCAWTVLDCQYFHLAQRRERLFVVGYLGDWRRAAAVLFERESLRGDTAPSREAGEVASAFLASRFGGGGACVDAAQANRLVAAQCHGSNVGPMGALRKGNGGVTGGVPFVAHPLLAKGNSSHDDSLGTYIPVVVNARQDPIVTNIAQPLDTDGHTQAIAFTCKDGGADAGQIAPTLRAMGHDQSHANGGGQVAVAIAENQRGELRTSDTVPALSSKGGGKPGQGYPAVQTGLRVRRLMPIECEKLQGIPPNYTNIQYRGKPAADSPRYKAIGNGVPVPVLRWIGARIAAVDRIK